MEIIQDMIPKGRINRPGVKNSCTYITIHDTANKKKGADAAAHARYIKTITNKTSWHYTVDDHSIYQHIPDEEKSYSTSDKEANENSIAVEMCVNSDGDYGKTVENTIYLVRELIKKHGILPSRICRHEYWTGKNCPASMSEEEWREFVKRCAEKEDDKFITIDELRAMGYVGVKW
ncbi:MAG: N-acetylmuramoyl-L-alanine amidase [Oscillospiraceae bacterium]|nr:N-acetylmuramoyl-L-alanine amidase [Oscillospiraceae bacterium]MBQ7054113.1 N-acetylmuramoyl-L-alanine amidase [Oscillospiraceae bacterium]